MSNGKRTLGVIFGGRSGEHEVSLMSARSVFPVINTARYEIVPIGITQQGVWISAPDASHAEVQEALTTDKLGRLTRVALLPEAGHAVLYAIDGGRLEPLAYLDVVFPLLHGTFGEDGTIQGLLELTDLAYVGAGVLGSAVGMDKAVFKDVMRAHGLPVVNWITATRAEIEQDAQAVIERAELLGEYPLFTKPANLGSSVGITKCRSRSDLYEGLMESAAYDRRVLIEHGVDGAREIEVSVLGNEHPQASIAGEVRPSADFYTYEAKYLDDRSELIIPAPLSPQQQETLQRLAVAAFTAVDGAGMARVDFLLDPRTQEFFISELNTIPGFTKISMYPKLWEASGLPYAALVDRLIDLALERKSERDRTVRQLRRNV